MKATTRGMVLPVVLFGLLGISLMGIGLVAVARSEILSERSSLRYARGAAVARSVLQGASSARERTSWSLSSGFELVGVASDPPGLTHFAVRWRLPPDQLAAALPGAVEAHTLPTSGVEVAPSCPGSLGRPMTRHRAAAATGSPGPKLGILGAADLVALAERIVGSLRGIEEPGVFYVGEGNQIGSGEAFGVLVSTADIVLEGTSRFTGLVVADGSVRIRGSSRVEGVVLAGESVSVEGDALIAGCVDSARDALGLPALAGPHQLVGGHLGRY